MAERFRKVTVLTGHYGCGKTNLAVNLALMLAQYGRVSVVDTDIVNPYFRTADFTKMLEKQGINVVYPMYAGTNLDIPVLDFDLERIVNESDYTVIDAGGSDAGAFPLGRFGRLFGGLGDELSVIYVFNMYRLVDRSAEETVRIMREIERASGLKCTAVVNNSNLGSETTAEIIDNSRDFADKVCALTGLPLAFTCVCEEKDTDGGNFLVKRIVTLPWENSEESEI